MIGYAALNLMEGLSENVQWYDLVSVKPPRIPAPDFACFCTLNDLVSVKLFGRWTLQAHRFCTLNDLVSVKLL